MKQLTKDRFSKYTSNSYNSIPEKQSPVKNWGKDLKSHYSKEHKEMANKHIKRCSTSLVIRETQIKTTMRYHLTLVRMVIIKKSTDSKCWTRYGKKGTLLHCWQECKLIQPLWKMLWRFFRKLGMKLIYDQQSQPQTYILQIPKLKQTHVTQCLLQQYLQQLEHGSNLDVHQQMNG